MHLLPISGIRPQSPHQLVLLSTNDLRPTLFNHIRAAAQARYPHPSAAHSSPWYPIGMDTSEAGRLGALATNKKLTKKQRKAISAKLLRHVGLKRKYELEKPKA